MFSGMNATSLLLILGIVVLVFGTKKLKGMGSDVGGAIKGFRKAMRDDDDSEPAQISNDQSANTPARENSNASQQQ